MITMEMWEAAGDFSEIAKAGDEVERAIVDVFLNSVPPYVHRADYIQCGEAYSHELDERTGRYKATYPTFEREDGRWYFRGYCFLGESIEPRDK